MYWREPKYNCPVSTVLFFIFSKKKKKKSFFLPDQSHVFTPKRLELWVPGTTFHRTTQFFQPVVVCISTTVLIPQSLGKLVHWHMKKGHFCEWLWTLPSLTQCLYVEAQWPNKNVCDWRLWKKAKMQQKYSAPQAPPPKIPVILENTTCQHGEFGG